MALLATRRCAWPRRTRWLRKRVIQDADAGLSSKELAARYHVSRTWVNALKQRCRETGAIAPHKQTKFRRRVLEGQEDRLRALVTAQPDATLAELRDALRTAAIYGSVRVARARTQACCPGNCACRQLDRPSHQRGDTTTPCGWPRRSQGATVNRSRCFSWDLSQPALDVSSVRSRQDNAARAAGRKI